MKIVGIGDPFIPERYIKEGFCEFEKLGHEVSTIQWAVPSHEELQRINLLVEVNGCEAYEPPQEVIDAICDADMVITQFCPMTKAVIDACKNLKIIGVLRGGYENINVDYATEKGILIYNTPGRNSNAVADFAVGMVLSESRNIAKSHRNLKEGSWIRDYANAATVPDMPYKTVGIVGFGEIGRKVAQRLRGFEMNILIYDPYVTSVPNYVTQVSMEELFKQSHFITLHMRLSKETEHMINKETLALMREDAYLINTARSGLVDEVALHEALANKKIIGAALDVFDVEPPAKDYPLVALDNVTITPHLAGGTIDAFTNSPRLIAAEMIKILNQETSRYVVNKELFAFVAAKL
ncbi:2-hydroxyacid dehydrogenase [Chakrabartyella piscis]|uniref:2-hydroxyacid dehydrogenase n=1 Tax=Chakrabartyella piscis TaxID=2918914 RepID=UPI0029587409|nr:2-hydroxyacid dehydrogenase [Chakrabartyella piscis]